jgi:hypothetical protein
MSVLNVIKQFKQTNTHETAGDSLSREINDLLIKVTRLYADVRKTHELISYFVHTASLSQSYDENISLFLTSKDFIQLISSYFKEMTSLQRSLCWDVFFVKSKTIDEEHLIIAKSEQENENENESTATLSKYNSTILVLFIIFLEYENDRRITLG